MVQAEGERKAPRYNTTGFSREDTKKIEEEFTNSIFQLGNRLGDNVPAEIAFGTIAESTRNQVTHDFFSLVNQNIQQGGMSVERAIFDKKRGGDNRKESHVGLNAQKGKSQRLQQN